MQQERPGAVTFKGTPFTLLGPELKAGDRAPDFSAVTTDLQPAGLKTYGGKVKVISAVPSLDTPVCDAQTRRFNEEAARITGPVQVLTISMDLPFAQKRWCGAAGVNRVTTLSDHREGSFGLNWGLLIKEGPLARLLARAVFVVDPKDRIVHAEYVKEIAEHPDYDAALATVRSML